MAEWKQTPEPYIKVQERVMTATLNPTVGEDLIVGVTFISDAGPSSPTLITSQSEFLKTYAAEEVTKEYLNSLNSMYSGDITDLPMTMWANAYRLAGSTNLLCVRASKGDNLYFTKPLDTDPGENDKFILKDGEFLKSIDGGFKITYDEAGDQGRVNTDNGWSINVRGVGIFGNRTDDKGPKYDYYCGSLIELVEKLNETSKFFAPAPKFYTDSEEETTVDSSVKYVVFEEVYLAPEFLDKSDDRCPDGIQYLIVSEISAKDPEQSTIDLNVVTGFEPSEYFALNVYNSRSQLGVRIRRFNHDAVISKTLNDDQIKSLTKTGASPFTVLTDVLDVYTKKGTKDPDETVLERDFFEIAVFDPSINDTVSFFNIGNITGRGDIEVSELNDLLNMISLNLPDDLHDLGLNYFDYKDGRSWEKLPSLPVGITPVIVESLPELEDARENVVYQVGDDLAEAEYYKLKIANQRYVDLSIDPEKTAILNITDSDLLRAIDKIQENEVYIVEGLSDLGNTNLMFQNYLANLAKSEDGNYFYPISSLNSTNYMTIGNGATKLSAADSYKHYISAPWDIDTGTLGIKFFASPSVLYWEGVSSNYRDGRPYVSLFGQTYGKVNYQRPTCEFNKKQRQLLLSRKVNTVMWNTNAQMWQMNDNYTRQTENTIMNDEGNVRMGIHIAKVQPILLAQFIGKKITDRLCEDIRGVEEYWIDNNIMNLQGNRPEEVRVFCSYDPELARQNKVKVVINVRFSRSLKFVTVVDRFFDTGMDISNPE